MALFDEQAAHSEDTAMAVYGWMSGQLNALENEEAFWTVSRELH